MEWTSEIGTLLLRELEKLLLKEQPLEQKIKLVQALIARVYIQLTSEEKLRFSTFYSRIAYAGHRHQLSKRCLFFTYAFRKENQKKKLSNKEILGLGAYAVTLVLEEIASVKPNESLEALLPERGFYNPPHRSLVERKDLARVVLLEQSETGNYFEGIDEERPDEPIKICLEHENLREEFKKTVTALGKLFPFPCTLHLLEVGIDKSGTYFPKAFIVEPDYLVDATAIASCFQADGTNVISYLLKKFLPFSSSPSLMLGNIANMYLDELVADPEVTFQALLPKIFKLNPIAISLFGDRELRDILAKSQKHFYNLQQMVKKGFQERNIDPSHSFLEPSFYSDKYGLQGRLDLFYQEGKEAAIVELKSGKLFMPNAYQINHSHYVQTLMYDLLVKSVFGASAKPINYILYSGLDIEPLKFAPAAISQQYEALALRNRIMGMEQHLAQYIGEGLDAAIVFSQIGTHRFSKVKGFLARDIQRFEKTYAQADSLEQKYFRAFSSFLAREHQLAKTGVHGLETSNGLASLWLTSEAEKEEQFDLLGYLRVSKVETVRESLVVRFNRTEQTNPLANFRKGDIAVLYPYEKAASTALDNQILKCTVVDLDAQEVAVQLRSKQIRPEYLESVDLWHLEHDLLDSSFAGQYRSLFAFLEQSKPKRDLLMGRLSPKKPIARQEPLFSMAQQIVTDEQETVINEIINSDDFYLLWGPPGTGKTSIVIKNVVGTLYEKSEESILLLAYTNRAVDEICHAIESYGNGLEKGYIRIGSGHSCAPEFKDKLLVEKVAGIEKRQELKYMIASYRVYVSTVASISNRLDFFQLKHFDRVIIDEASQILEPALVGLLPHFKQFTLVGDHNQLPAVVVQDKEQIAIQDEELLSIGLNNLSNSYFERMYHLCLSQNWAWALGTLSHQGRMHEEIMRFPNELFYQHNLKTLPLNIPGAERQAAHLAKTETYPDYLQQRVVFINTPIDEVTPGGKVNQFEAQRIAEILLGFQSIGRGASEISTGVITPYRAQIAQIKESLESAGIDNSILTIDTVERYQGGAREIIIISLCTNRLGQLESLVSLSGNGEVDRKLNVALTRARQHLIVLGNKDILMNNRIYSEFIRRYELL